MPLQYLRRDNELKDHRLSDDRYFGTSAPSVLYEKKPIRDAAGTQVDGPYSVWVSINNPDRFNACTTDMLKGVIAGFQQASADRSVVAVVFTGVGEKAFFTGGNVGDFAAYYSRRPQEYGTYMDLFNTMVDNVLSCQKPVICRVNGARVAGGQEVGLACDLTVTSDLAVFGQASPRHGSAPLGGTTDFLPWFLSIEDATYNCVSCETWSAYKMKAKNLVTKVVPVLRKDGQWLRNPLVRTDTYVDDGEIVYGEPVPPDELKSAKELLAQCTTDFSRLDAAVDEMLWKFANLFPHCLMKSIDGIRGKKKFFWDQMKSVNRHWLAANMNSDAWLGFSAMDSKKITGTDTIDFIKYRQLVAQGAVFDDAFAAQVLRPPKA